MHTTPASRISIIRLRSIAATAIPRTQLDTDTCSLLGPFSILIQGIMALIILASLLYKRHREKPKRKYRIWTADVSKQVLGQAFVHMLNIFISDSMASLPSKGNPCALYFMNIFIDTTIGVFVLFLALNTITKLVCKSLGRTPSSLGLSSGTYPHPFLKSWLKQISIYFLGLVILKLFVIGLFWLGGEALVQFGNGVIEGISHDPKVQILMVVMVGPTILNVLQFLLIDSFIKHKPALPPDDAEPEDGRRFLAGDSDRDSDEHDDDDDNDNEDDEDEEDDEHGRKPRGADRSSRQDRFMRKKKDLHGHPSTRHQQSTLSNPSNLHGALSGLPTDVQTPHSYPPRSSLQGDETRERSRSEFTPRLVTTHKPAEARGEMQTWAVPEEGRATTTRQVPPSHSPGRLSPTQPRTGRPPMKPFPLRLSLSPHTASPPTSPTQPITGTRPGIHLSPLDPAPLPAATSPSHHLAQPLLYHLNHPVY
ncbi:hypothetical protein PCASD_05807 [Puccinia coronata f. sp. avenae]|uniref:Vacuolar membrane protein n=1 Tax=Puccinia coronata f. sp. avenae TaxID=200324 RepID=A0A2N5V1G3_9BASI|nr:hypothetical protein PCASD_05807 [Puccinia coronata f. sp. avenae]